MTKLEREALGTLSMSKESVEELYANADRLSCPGRLRNLCESHERLRMELEGAEIMLRDVGVWELETDAAPSLAGPGVPPAGMGQPGRGAE